MFRRFIKPFSMAVCIALVCVVITSCFHKQIAPSPSSTVVPTQNTVPPSSTAGSFTQPTPMTAFADTLDFAYGLFSIGINEAYVPQDTGGHLFGMEQYMSENKDFIIAVNYAPSETYEDTAAKKLDSYISYVFAILMSGETSEYSESEIVTEHWSQSNAKVQARWQIMTKKNKAIWFEIRTPIMGYNVCIVQTKGSDEQLLKDMMYSFQYNPEIETDFCEQLYTQNADGTFVTSDHGLQLALGGEWAPVHGMDVADMVLCAERNNAEQLIQIFRYPQVSSIEELSAGFDTMLKQIEVGMNDTGIWGDVKTISLPNLNTEAYFVEVEWSSGAIAQYVFFSRGFYTYYGNFMWMKNTNWRSNIEAAMLSLAPAYA